MIKLLFVTNHLQYSDGVAKALLNLTNNLDKTKYDITIAPLYKIEPEFAKLFDKNIRIKKVFNTYFRGLAKIVKLIPNFILRKKVIGNNKYDVVIAYQFGVPTQLLSNKKITNKKIAFMHGYDESAIKYHPKYNQVVCVSKNACFKYKDILSFPEKITYCNNVIDIDNILSSAQSECIESEAILKLQKPTFAFVGRLSPEKGILRAIEAMKLLKDDGYKFSYAIIGGGPQKDEIVAKINELGLQNYVKLYGRQTNPYVYLNKCDYYVCSSFGEGLCTACIEASILNKPIISTQVSGAEEIVSEHNVGLVVENSQEGIYSGLKQVLDHPELNHEWQRNFEQANKKWNKDYILTRFDKIISEVLK